MACVCPWQVYWGIVWRGSRNVAVIVSPGHDMISCGGETGLGADSRFAPSQWETALLCNDVSHWLSTNLESDLRSECRQGIHLTGNHCIEWWGQFGGFCISENLSIDDCYFGTSFITHWVFSGEIIRIFAVVRWITVTITYQAKTSVQMGYMLQGLWKVVWCLEAPGHYLNHCWPSLAVPSHIFL